jgi:hypothetical protein
VLPVSTCVSVTGQYHKARQQSPVFGAIPVRSEVMNLHEAIALKNPVLAQPAAAPGALFSPYRLGDLDLPNRLVMSPMTRSRAVDGNVPNPLAPPITPSAPPPG